MTSIQIDIHTNKTIKVFHLIDFPSPRMEAWKFINIMQYGIEKFSQGIMPGCISDDYFKMHQVIIVSF